MGMDTISAVRTFGGTQGVYSHTSQTLGCDMRFSVFVPEGDGPFPAIWYLSGLTCTEENATTKAGFQRVAAELGLIIICPDTSPRGDHVPDEDTYDFAKGAGFYLDATETPWAQHYRMESYLTGELRELVEHSFPINAARMGITGHSMGGHGALTLALKNPVLYKSVSAFAPIVAPTQCPWGQKALARYLGPDESTWRSYDACALLADKGPHPSDMLVDQGLADTFLEEQLKPELLEDAAKNAGQKLTLRRHAGYDHSYYFIATFIEDHLRHHAKHLRQ